MMSIMSIGFMMRELRLMQITPDLGNKQILVLVYCHSWKPCSLPWTCYSRSKTSLGLSCWNLASLFSWWRKPGSYMPWKNISCAEWNYSLVLLTARDFHWYETSACLPAGYLPWLWHSFWFSLVSDLNTVSVQYLLYLISFADLSWGNWNIVSVTNE